MIGVDDLSVDLVDRGVSGIRSISATPSEADRTLLVRADSGDVVVKEFPADSTAARMQVELLNAVAAGAPALPVPRVIADARTGSDLDATGTVFVSTLLAGRPLEDATVTESLVDEIADAQALLLSALAAVDAGSAGVPPTNEWAIDAIRRHRALFATHLDADELRRAEQVFHAYTAIEPAVAALPRQVLHADFNLSNLLVTDGSLTGIIDFGDAIEAPRVFDVAVTCAYLAMHLGSLTHPLVERYLDRIAGAAELGTAELALVPTLALCRVVIVLALGRETATRWPDRAAYQRRYDSLAARVLADADVSVSPPHQPPTKVPPVTTTTPAGEQMINRFDPARAAGLSEADQVLLARRRATLGDIYPLFYDKPVHVVRGSGARLIDADGIEYLDAYNNVPAVGHANPRVAEAVYRQLTRMNTHTRYLQDGVVDYAERFLATYPAALDHVIFTNSGSEANDLALAIAAWRTGRTGVIVTRVAYHGTTTVLAGVSPENGPSMPLAPYVRVVDAPDTLVHGDRAGAVFADAVSAAIADLDAAGLGVRALLIDTIMSTDGIYPGPCGMLADAFARVQAAGGLVIADEVQPGMGRLGEHMWGFQRHTDTVDMVTCGKPLAGGLPIGSLVLSRELSDDYAREHRYFNTFGGNPASIAAATAVLDEIEDRGLLGSALQVGGLLRDGIAVASRDSALVADVRGVGLFVGVEMSATDDRSAREVARAMVNGLRDRNVLISAVGIDGQVLKVRPPLVFTADDTTEFLSVYADVLSDVEKKGVAR
ncbi:4-aminobutyrate aminotransferase-like enzyme/Ser/Thr protein kinase RdoA (MazF antagonist) [Microbacterium sp. SORGH_AS 1204]|uniref:aminotransferase class III-fold pyridoxal phosphate-dependent enzyme n=1 Tax=Microbacterium sp. SORGH_AS_1204 TaxID=3041785 RepID=UPI002790BFF3|nr:aminotransferase class III-fold pyridoxal phosphate-dependent enzyme [Microbacterium sp. SORGH_AS_1204]MDQ1136247.1 4-aminobutyrate aminotransferase-like enzyme/Ser/Thr protein kinase RdoA (MazF antagonist) [Microbacterium sp. SORGH_AS_1204]